MKKLIKSAAEKLGLEIKKLRPKIDTGENSYSNFGEQQVIEDILKSFSREPSYYYVDIGAGDGAHNSNTYFLLKRDWEGLAFELDNERFARLAYRYRLARGVCYSNTAVTPDNVSHLFKGYGVPAEFGLLNLDIDGYDYFVLKEILNNYHPAIGCIEINEKIPPPVKFTVTYSPDYIWHEDHFMGQSISKLEELCIKCDYDIVRVHYNNAFIVPRGLSSLPPLTAARAYQEGYLDMPDRREKFYYNHEFEELYSQGPEEVLAFFHNFFKKYEGKFECYL